MGETTRGSFACGFRRHADGNLWQKLVYAMVLGQRTMSSSVMRSTLRAMLAESDGSGVQEDGGPEIEGEWAGEAGGYFNSTAVWGEILSTSMRMYLRQVCLDAARENLRLVDQFLECQESDYRVILPSDAYGGSTQPVTVAYWRVACATAILRDVSRQRTVFDRLDESPVGTCELIGVPSHVDRHLAARLLGFQRVLPNALDGVISRDHLAEAVSSMTHNLGTLCRITEEVAMWAGPEFGACHVSEPGTRPLRELSPSTVRLGFDSRPTFESFAQLLTSTTEIALAYSWDLSEEQDIITTVVHTYLSELRGASAWLRTLSFDEDRGEQLCWEDYSTSVGLTSYLVNECDVGFREASRVSGQVVNVLRRDNYVLRHTDRVAEILANLGHVISPRLLDRILAPRTVVSMSTGHGGTSASSVESLGAELAETAAFHQRWVGGHQRRLDGMQSAIRDVARQVIDGAELDQALLTALAEPQ